MLDQKVMMSQFRQVNSYASLHGFVGAYPNFHRADHGHGIVNGTFLLKAPFAEWKDIPLSELDHCDLNDLAARFRATAVWATNHGYAVGFPNFFQADYGHGIVCGTVLLSSNAVEWRDIPIAELNNVSLTDLDGRLRETANYASRHSFLGGFPNFFQADYGHGTVCGTFLLKPNVAEWKDICITPFANIEVRTGFSDPNHPDLTPKYVDVRGLGFYPNGQVKVDYDINFGVGSNSIGSVTGNSNKEGEIFIDIPVTAHDLANYQYISARITDLTNTSFADARKDAPVR